MATEKPIEPVQLEEDDLRNVRSAAAQMEESLRTMSAVAQRVLGREPPGAYESQEKRNEFIIFAPGSSMQIHSNPPDGWCYVMIDPPGITRPCTIAESTTCHEVEEVLKTLRA